jgi:hypothetical protein
MSKEIAKNVMHLGMSELRWKVLEIAEKNYSAIVEVVLLGVLVDTFCFSQSVLQHRCEQKVGEAEVIADVQFRDGVLTIKEFTCHHGAKHQQMMNYTLWQKEEHVS